jgi:predicted ATPase/DNA-binding SARP family transcriptional activator
MLTVAVLGPLAVTRAGRRVEVPNGKTTELVVRLALEGGAIVRADRLVDDLWAGGGPATRRNTLQAKVALLRRAVGDPGAVVSRDGGYGLAVDASSVDALAALQLTARAADLLDSGDNRGAVELCVSTSRLYRGEVLQAAGDGAWVGSHRTRLEEARLELLQVGFAGRLRLGEADGVIGELESAVVTHPFREGLWELLVTALYRSGRQADALAAYRRVRAQLADELGLEPGPDLKRLEERILTQDPSLAGSDRAGSRPTPPTMRAGNLPSMAAELVGRSDEIDELCELLGTRRLVELVGPGGVGKTALAVAVGRALVADGDRALDGVWLTRLETASTPAEVADALVGAFGGPGGEAALLERLEDTSAVVILDNCEQVVDAAADLAVRLLDAAPRVKVLCTSQVPLDVDGETVVEVAPLGLAAATDLFTRRASAQGRRHRAQPEAAAVVELCTALDGLPLAIELAAARTRTLTVPEIIRRLDDRFDVLVDPTSRRPDRRRALRSTIAWSYDLLFPDDQRGLWALATFAGGAPAPAVESVLEALQVPRAAAIDVVGRLASRSLLTVDEEGGSVRYRLLDSIRAFALTALADSGLDRPARAAHAGWLADAASTSTAGVRSARQAEHLAFARSERANIDAALMWTSTEDPMLGLRIANGFGWGWIVLGDGRGAQRILAALDAAGDQAPPSMRADALLLAAWIEASGGDLSPARRHLAEARQLAGAIGAPDLEARCCYHLAYVVSHHGEFQHALGLTDRARAVLEGMDRPWDRAANALFAARAAISAADVDRSVEAAAEVQHWLRRVEDPWLRVRGDATLGDVARLQGRFDEALARIGAAARTSRHLGFQQTEAYQVFSLGRAQCQSGDYDVGTHTLELGLDKAQAIGDVRLAALARVHLGRVLRACGQVAGARAQLETATRWHRGSGGGELAALGECLLAAIDAADQVPGARGRLDAALGRARAEGDAAAEVFALDALARAAAGAGDTVGARGLVGEADRRMEAADFLTGRDRIDAHWVRDRSGSATAAQQVAR